MISSLKALKTQAGDMTLKVQMSNGRVIFLHSHIDPVAEAKRWVNKCKIQEYTAYVVVGLGLGYHLRELLQKISDSCFVYVIDPLLEEPLYLQFFLKWQKNNSWLQKSQQLQIFGKQELFTVAGLLNKNMQNMNLNQVKVICYYPAMILPSNAYSPYLNKLTKKAESLHKADIEFSLAAGQKMFENAWDNLNVILQQTGISVLKNKFCNLPAVVVSAGPSLNKNISVLRKYKDNVVIVASGTAIGALRKNDIVPHFLVIIDPFDLNSEVLKGFLHKKTVLIAPYDAPPQLIKAHPGKICFYKKPLRNTDEHVLSSIETYLHKTGSLLGHISVAVTAFSFAEWIGANPIAFIGQDLSFPLEAFEKENSSNLKMTHADGVKAGTYEPTRFKKDVCWVEGFFGGTVPTINEFRLVIDFFGVLFKARKKTRLIFNATEGGAYLSGAIHKSLEEVAKENFRKPIPFDNQLQDYLKNIECNYQALIEELQEVQQQAKEIYTKVSELQCEYLKSGEMKLSSTEKAEFSQKVYGLLEYTCSNKIYCFIKPYFSTIVDLFNLERQEGITQEKDFLRCVSMLKGLGQGISIFSEKAGQVLTMILEEHRKR